MGSTRRRHTQEYKAEAVELVINSGRPIVEVARNLGINEGTLGNWLNKAKRDGSEGYSRAPINESPTARLLGRRSVSRKNWVSTLNSKKRTVENVPYHRVDQG